MDLQFISKSDGTKVVEKKIEKSQPINKTALIVDDSKVNQSILDNFLQQLGYKTFFADDGEEGVNKFDSIKPSITFLDIVMPKKPGLQVLKEIKLLDPNAIVIMVSSFTTKENIHEAKKSEADWFLKKPLSKEKIQQIVELVEQKSKTGVT